MGLGLFPYTVQARTPNQRRIVTDQEHEQRDEATSEERGETMKDLDVPEEQAEDVKGGAAPGDDDDDLSGGLD